MWTRPRTPKDYLHRAGRTARAGESGTVVTLVLPRQQRPTFAMLESAGVAPVRTEVTASAPALAELTGARRPSACRSRGAASRRHFRRANAVGRTEHRRPYGTRGGGEGRLAGDTVQWPLLPGPPGPPLRRHAPPLRPRPPSPLVTDLASVRSAAQARRPTPCRPLGFGPQRRLGAKAEARLCSSRGEPGLVRVRWSRAWPNSTTALFWTRTDQAGVRAGRARRPARLWHAHGVVLAAQPLPFSCRYDIYDRCGRRHRRFEATVEGPGLSGQCGWSGPRPAGGSPPRGGRPGRGAASGGRAAGRAARHDDPGKLADALDVDLALFTADKHAAGTPPRACWTPTGLEPYRRSRLGAAAEPGSWTPEQIYTVAGHGRVPSPAAPSPPMSASTPTVTSCATPAWPSGRDPAAIGQKTLHPRHMRGQIEPLRTHPLIGVVRVRVALATVTQQRHQGACRPARASRR